MVVRAIVLAPSTYLAYSNKNLARMILELVNLFVLHNALFQVGNSVRSFSLS